MRIGLITTVLVTGSLLVSSCWRGAEQNSVNLSLDTLGEVSVPESFPYQIKKFDWTTLERNVPDDVKRAFVDSMEWYKDMYDDTDFHKHVHVVDLDGNGVDDYIYSGPGPVDEFTVVKIDSIFFTAFVEIIDLEMEDGILTKVYTRSTLATAGPAITGQDIFKVNLRHGKKTIEWKFSGMVIEPLVVPSYWFDPYKVLSIISDTTILRSDPEVNNSPGEGFYQNLNGNQLGTLSKGGKVYLVGELTNDKGEKWHFVLIPPNVEVVGFPEYEGNKFDPKSTMHCTGWIKALP